MRYLEHLIGAQRSERPPGTPFGASGPKHSRGLVPDPGAIASTARFLREDGNFASALPVFNVKEYGATGAGAIDDTAAIQAAINAAVAAGGGRVYAPGGNTFGFTKLDLAEIQGVTLFGDGWNVTRFMPLGSYDGGTGHLFDCTGSFNLTFRDFQVGAFNQTPVPATCFFLAQTAANLGNALHLEGLYITGKYVTAPLYIYGVPSSTAVNCDFYNYTTSASTWTAVFDSTNSAGLSSTFATVGAGSRSTSDWNFFGCEFHRFGGNANGYCISLRETATADIHFIGGNITAGGSAYVIVTAAATPPSNILFEGVTLETEGEPTPTNIADIVGGVAVGLEFKACSFIVTNKTFGSGSNGTFRPASSGQSMAFAPAGTIAANTTEYLGPATKDAAEANALFIAPQAGLLTQFRASCTASPGQTPGYTYHVMVNSAASAMTSVISGGATSANDLLHIVRVSAGDTVSVRVVTAAATNVGHHRASFVFVPLD